VEDVDDVEDFDDVVEDVDDVEDFDDVLISWDSAATGCSSFVFLSNSPGNDEMVAAPDEAPTGKGFFEVSLPSILFPKDDRP